MESLSNYIHLYLLSINGPATSNYDVDLGTYTVQDWYYITAYQAAARAMLFSTSAPPPAGDNILVNGTNKKGNTGKYNNVKIQKDKKYRLRLVNPSLDAAIRVSLDGHPFTVIANDFVPGMSEYMIVLNMADISSGALQH